jgi:hypothetical protein
MRHTLRLLEDSIPAGAEPVFLPGGPRGLLVLEGHVTVETAAANQHLPTRTAWVGSEEIAYVAGASAARILRWELVEASADASHDGRLRGAPKTKSTVKSTQRLDLDRAFGWLLRVDQVSFPKGTNAHLHVHQGPGIRYVLSGEMDHRATGAPPQHFKPGDPFYEDGIHTPIFVIMSKTEETVFVRGLLLPRAVKGRGSTRFVNPEDWANPPRHQSYHVFAERFIEVG